MTGVHAHASRPDEELFGIPHLGRATLVGAVAGIVLVLTGAGLAVLVTDLPVPYLAAAAHAALFGGTGFGAMLAAVLQATRHTSTPAKATRRHQRLDRTTITPPTINSREKEPA